MKIKKLRVVKDGTPCGVGTVLFGNTYLKADPPKVEIIRLTNKSLTLKWINRGGFVPTFNLTIKEFKESKWTPLNGGLPIKS